LDSTQTKAAYIAERLDNLRKQGLYRELATVTYDNSDAFVNGKKAINLSSNDYLGLSRSRTVIRAAGTTQQVSPCSSRLLSGNHPQFDLLESELARHRKTEAALVYPTGYAACVGALTALASKGTVIFSDERNHASIIDGCRLSGARVEVFPHNNFLRLARLMKKHDGRKIIVTEGIFSMDGDVAGLNEMDKLAQEHDAITIVDDAHGDFIRGPRFSGTPGELGVKVDVHISSLSKALGCFGGYVASSEKVRQLLINASKQFIYTSALPESLCSAATVAIREARNGRRQERLKKNITRFFKLLTELGFPLDEPKSQIMPIVIGDEKEAVTFSQLLLHCGVFAPAVRYPTVPRGKARIRVSLTSLLTGIEIVRSVNAFKRAELSTKNIP
jgi:glycine C-acetyltransferase